MKAFSKHAFKLPEARKLLAEFLNKMPVEIAAYANRNNCQFVDRLKSAGVPHESG